MCNRVATPEIEHIKAFAEPRGVQVLDYRVYFEVNSFIKPMLPVQLNSSPDTIRPAVWTLVAYGEVKDWKTATYNARAEEIFETKSYRNFIGKNRGLLYVRGFYEPHTLPSPTGKGKDIKQPYFIERKDKEIFTLGVVWAPAKQNGEWVPTFSIITTQANDLLQRVHNNGGERMPLIIPPERHASWMRELDRDGIIDHMQPLPDGQLQAYPVTTDVYKTSIDTDYPETLLPVGEVWE